MFFKIAVLKNFANFTEKHLYWDYFLIHFRPIFPFYTPLKIEKQRFSDVFEGYRKGALA